VGVNTWFGDGYVVGVVGGSEAVEDKIYFGEEVFLEDVRKKVFYVEGESLDVEVMGCGVVMEGADFAFEGFGVVEGEAMEVGVGEDGV